VTARATSVSALSEAQRATLAEMADVLIPGGEGMPSAREVGVQAALVDRVLAVRPQAATELPALLQRLATEDGSVADRLSVLRAGEPGAFNLVSSVIVGAYFLDDRVREAIGFPGQGPRDVTFEDETGYVAEGLLDSVLERGPRPTQV
jgi:hypothetical protein